MGVKSLYFLEDELFESLRSWNLIVHLEFPSKYMKNVFCSKGGGGPFWTIIQNVANAISSMHIFCPSSHWCFTVFTFRKSTSLHVYDFQGWWNLKPLFLTSINLLYRNPIKQHPSHIVLWWVVFLLKQSTNIWNSKNKEQLQSFFKICQLHLCMTPRNTSVNHTRSWGFKHFMKISGEMHGNCGCLENRKLLL